ncbi:hypothetical protein D5S17_33455 [Pseudonocardiaceae bacterium YIM PH 21723]|nr:hypothetical protein D5S17_33455 [Pseudonocardiaceae bacterium YIM PH 21723]
MSDRSLRRRCRRLLRELDVRPPLDVELLCRQLGERRGRPIQLVPHPIPVPGPFGAWIATDSTDYIFFQQETSKSHQDHIVLHELGHILAGHGSDEQDDALTGEFPDLAPDAVRRALRRTSYDTAQEREAETVASIILEWASVLDHVAPRLSESDTPVGRYGDALADRIGWL